MDLIQTYITRVRDVRKTGVATEHSYRSALEYLFSSLSKEIHALNEPRRVAVGAPDFIIQRGDIVVGHAEAKDLGVDIHHLKGANKEQQERYVKGLPNLIYTNCLDFDFYRNGELVAQSTIAHIKGGLITKVAGADDLEPLLREFIRQRPQTITSPRVLAEIMAGKAALIKDVLTRALTADDTRETELANQFRAFRQHLIHDITPSEFSDIYAETIAYGMFAARLHDDSLDTFSRLEALELLPKSNPFLRSLFGYIAGPDLDDRLRWILDDLADAFQACDVGKLMKGFGRLTGQNDPFLHFYETFLAAYNPAKRKSRGVWYTPEPVVNFIVRAVDHVLRTEFGIPEGLADTSKIEIDWDTGQRATTKAGRLSKSSHNSIERREVHRIQILDPATGTGTFLAEVIKEIAPRIKSAGPALWSQYIERDLIPRLHGFELLMASYAMCHVKLDMVLSELGYRPTSTPPRLSVYLTNSLEEGEPANQTLPFAQWLSNEVKQANAIKRDMPIMCVIGNPPYSGISQNMGDWIVDLIEGYKYVEGVHFGERKHWLHDDYVKFMRMAEHLIEKNGEGVLGFITNHGYLANPTFRGMRWHLLQTFDKIFVLDLHGNANKRETGPGGSADKNIFDIRQGVSIIIAFRKAGGSKRAADVFHSEIWGDRESKNIAIGAKSLDKGFKHLTPRAPYFMFYDVNLEALDVYDQGFSISEMFPAKSTGIISARDDFAVGLNRKELRTRMKRFLDPTLSDQEARTEFFGSKKDGKYLAGDSRGWRLSEKRPQLEAVNLDAFVRPILYRPFDERWIVYHSDVVDWPRTETMGHFTEGENIALVCPRMTSDPFSPLATSKIISNKTASRYDQSYFFPLYIEARNASLDTERRVNLAPALFKKLRKLGKHPSRGEPDELAVFDYIYGVLHAPNYRETYSEFLSIDFARIPWPRSPAQFWDIASKGSELRMLHLMKVPSGRRTVSSLEGEGDNVIGRVHFEGGRVWINDQQFFGGVPVESWEFFIGGYQPAQKWLKDRKAESLSLEDVRHYQEVIGILHKTHLIMESISLDLIHS